MDILEEQEVKFEPLLSEIKQQEDEQMKTITDDSSKLIKEVNNAFDKKNAILERDRNALIKEIKDKEKASLQQLNLVRISNESDKNAIISSSSMQSAKEIALNVKTNLTKTFKAIWKKERFVPNAQFESRRSNLVGYFNQEGESEYLYFYKYKN
jgi:hypothetical protein